jgi:hypothetical protein
VKLRIHSAKTYDDDSRMLDKRKLTHSSYRDALQCFLSFSLTELGGKLSIHFYHAPNPCVFNDGGEGGIRTHGTVSRTLAFEASTFNRSVTSPRSWQVPS